MDLCVVSYMEMKLVFFNITANVFFCFFFFSQYKLGVTLVTRLDGLPTCPHPQASL